MTPPWNPPWLDRALLAGAVLVWAVALPVAPMDVDAAQYATMARELLERGDWLRITNRGENYLDKPPLVFWTGALSYALFGVGTVASKIPSFLFALLAVFSTERLATRLSDATTGRLAALVLASTQALFLITNDCRTDTLLMGAVAFACWQLVAFERDRSWRALLGSAVGLSLALHAKGPIGAAVPVLALGADVIARRAWRSLLEPRWLLVVALVAVSLVPMLVGLHDQFGADGPLFFLWTQSFGRLTGSNRWRDTTTPLFFTHTFLWSFLPWSLFALAAGWERIRALLPWPANRSESIETSRPAATGAAFPMGGFVIGFVGLSASQYKLPHYLFVVFPLAAVLTARWLAPRIDSAPSKAWRGAQAVLLAAVVGLVVVLCTWAFPGASLVLWGVAAIAFVLAAVSAIRSRETFGALVVPGVLVMLGANVMLGGHFYPALLRYQSPTEAARVVREKQLDPRRVHSYRIGNYALDDALQAIVTKLPDSEAIRRAAASGPIAVYTDDEGLAELTRAALPIERVESFDHFHVTMLTGPFLNPATRAKVVQRRHLVRVDPSR